jgi:hypothetical protein
VSQVEVGFFIIFGCLSTCHPLLAKYFSIGVKDYGDSGSFDLKAPEMVESGNCKPELSTQQAAGITAGKEYPMEDVNLED